MKSMTGFGRYEGKIGGARFTIEIKSVNHRYLDARFRLPQALSIYEMPLGEILRGAFERGSFEIVARQKIGAGDTTSGTTKFVIDETALESLMAACEKLHKRYHTEKVPSLEVLALTNKIFIPVDDTSDAEGSFAELKTLFTGAVKELSEMRAIEGKKLQAVLRTGIAQLAETVEKIRVLAPEQRPKILEKLKARIDQWAIGGVDAQRLEWELAFFAERAEITEELDRLKSHTEEFARLLGSTKSVGRKLDFLTQEMHREVNTLGAKTSLLAITQATVEAKAWIEKLREQVQNVE